MSTLRYFDPSWSKNCGNGQSIEVIDRAQRYLEDVIEVAVTHIDEYFDNSFLSLKTTTTLDHSNRWSEVINELKATSINISTVFNKNEHCYETLYTVPVTGYKIFNNQSNDNESVLYGCEKEFRIHRKPVSQFMYYKGRYYDIQLMYLLDRFATKNELKPYGPLVPKLPQFNNTSIIKLNNISYSSKLERTIHRAGIYHSSTDDGRRFYNRSTGWVQSMTVANDYLEIDLGQPQFVTHIGTCGQYPELQTFPKPIAPYGYKTRSQRKQLRSTCLNHVSVIKYDVSSLGWVTSYELKYRNMLTRKWMLVGIFDGNTNSINEAIHDLFNNYNTSGGLYTQYLRIVPLEYNNSPIIRVAVYGLPSPQQRSSSSNNNNNNNKRENKDAIIIGKNISSKIEENHLDYDIDNNDDSNYENDDDFANINNNNINNFEDLETVTYSVSEPLQKARTKRYDGFCKYGGHKYDPPLYSKYQKRTDHYNTIKQVLNDEYYFDF
eukprot:gene8989-12124_t